MKFWPPCWIFVFLAYSADWPVKMVLPRSPRPITALTSEGGPRGAGLEIAGFLSFLSVPRRFQEVLKLDYSLNLERLFLLIKSIHACTILRLQINNYR